MLRTFLTAIVISCVVGALLGYGVAYSLLAVNGWQQERETTPLKIPEPTPGDTNPNAKAYIEETTYYFGVMDVKSTGAHDFFIKNVGSEDLILELIRATCSCTGIDISPARVLPGETATCHLKYNAERSVTGKFSQGGIIRTNDPENTEISLLVEGVFTNPVVPAPSNVYFGNVPAGASRTATVKFYGFEKEALQFSAPKWTGGEHFDFHWEDAALPESNDDRTFESLATWVVQGTVTLKPGLPVGPILEQFQVQTNYPGMPSVSFLVSGQVIGNVSIRGKGYDPHTGVIHLGQTVVGKSLSRTFVIQFLGTLPPSAVCVKADPSWLRVSLVPLGDAGQFYNLVIDIPENAPTGSYLYGGGGQQAHVTLETEDKTPALKIPLQFVVGK